MTPTELPEKPPSNLGRRVLWGVGFGLVVVIGMLIASDASALVDSLGAFHWPVLVPVLGLSLFGYALRIAKWEIFIRRLGIRLPLLESAAIFVAGMIMSISPGKVGEVFKSFLLRSRHGIPVVRTAPVVLAERLTDFLALLILMAWGVASSGYGVGVLIAAATLCTLILLVALWTPATRASLWLLGKLPVLHRAAPAVEEALGSLQLLVGPRVLAGTTALSVIAWGGEAIGTWLVFNAFPGVEIDLATATFVYAFGTVAGALSMLPGGLLATEGSMVALLTRVFSVVPTEAIASAGTLVVRFATLWFGVALGGLALALLGRMAPRKVTDESRPPVP